jgi:flagellar motility protein MotE (MotC chaperone)
MNMPDNPTKDAERLAEARLASIRIRHSGNSEDRGCDYCFLVHQIARLTQERDEYCALSARLKSAIDAQPRIEETLHDRIAELEQECDDALDDHLRAHKYKVDLIFKVAELEKERDAALVSLAAKSQHYEGLLRELEAKLAEAQHRAEGLQNDRNLLSAGAKPQLAGASDVEQSNGAHEGAKPSAIQSSADDLAPTTTAR